MAIGTVVTRGFDTGSGSGGSVNLVVVRGYGSGAPAPTPSTVGGGGGGGRRKWEDVFPRRKRRKPKDSRPLTKAELSDLDALFRDRGEPVLSDRSVRAVPAVREAARALLLPHGPLPERPALELVHASPLKAEIPDVGPVSSLQARLTAQRAEQKRLARQQQLEREQEQREAEAVEQLLAAIAEAERVEAARVAWEQEQQRLEMERLAAEDALMFDLLMLAHEDVI